MDSPTELELDRTQCHAVFKEEPFPTQGKLRFETVNTNKKPRGCSYHIKKTGTGAKGRATTVYTFNTYVCSASSTTAMVATGLAT